MWSWKKELGLNIQSYEDLLDPALKGRIVLSDPNSSSAAWNNKCNIFAVYGYDTQEAWDYLRALLENGPGDLHLFLRVLQERGQRRICGWPYL